MYCVFKHKNKVIPLIKDPAIEDPFTEIFDSFENTYKTELPISVKEGKYYVGDFESQKTYTIMD